MHTGLAPSSEAHTQEAVAAAALPVSGSQVAEAERPTSAADRGGGGTLEAGTAEDVPPSVSATDPEQNESSAVHKP